MKYISNKAIDQIEFQNWVTEMEKDNKQLPTKERIDEIEKKRLGMQIITFGQTKM